MFAPKKTTGPYYHQQPGGESEHRSLVTTFSKPWGMDARRGGGRVAERIVSKLPGSQGWPEDQKDLGEFGFFWGWLESQLCRDYVS